MAISETVTLIPLHRVASYLGINPYHFNQIYTAQWPSGIMSCDDMWFQRDYQATGRLSRETLAHALRQAEDMAFDYLGWSPLPVWYEEEYPITKYYKPEAIRFLNSQYLKKSVNVRSKWVVEVGRKTKLFIANPVTVFSDADGDGYNETVTIIFATTVTEESELHVYYPFLDGRDDWEIRPLTSITIAGGIATIMFPRYLIPLYSLLDAAPIDGDPHIGIDGDDAANFLTSVDVYRVYTDTTQHGLLYYEPETTCANCCTNPSESACITIRNSRLGILSYDRADYNATTGTWAAASYSAEPMRIMVYYRAGTRDLRQRYPDIQMDQTLERMICFYALTFLDTQLAGCDNTRKIWQKMTRDLALVTGEQSYNMGWDLIKCPMGTTFAGYSLWKYLDQIRAKS